MQHYLNGMSVHLDTLFRVRTDSIKNENTSETVHAVGRSVYVQAEVYRMITTATALRAQFQIRSMPTHQQKVVAEGYAYWSQLSRPRNIESTPEQADQ